MAKVKLHNVKFTDLQILALASAEPKATEEGSLLGQLLNKAFFEAKEQLEEIAKRDILPNGETAPADEFDNPPLPEKTIAVSTDSENGVQVEAEKPEEKTAKKTKFTPSLD